MYSYLMRVQQKLTIISILLKLHKEFIAPNMEEIENYSAIEFLGSFPPSPKTRDKSPLPYFRPHKIMKTNSSGKIAITSNMQISYNLV